MKVSILTWMVDVKICMTANTVMVGKNTIIILTYIKQENVIKKIVNCLIYVLFIIMSQIEDFNNKIKKLNQESFQIKYRSNK